MRNNDVSTLVWQSTQTIPTVLEVTNARAACLSSLATRQAAKVQARLDVKNGSLTQGQRFLALLILLDYDQ